ncbi:SGNH/GDSL hydrolase family protein [Ottowia sp.]|jgi:lysophospholipase L1-like esterase|uniref:SGNH/GDSL hydrolase family protein n=1 Tax=Ottowia sp. TaxID=1898956 RepID=UPI0025E58FD5|nr:SGNH/GDSL hydrolase family protein [Ottowia sp.]MBK6612913.1 SGNH/GDSL hydrolase family protein [Ottowia sp.]MBK6747956.1 SGNH/GDSL hydrolase family protein [Ottowia sp.]
MQHILVYGDSLSWGIVPGTRQRLAFDARWPGVMEGALAAQGRRVRVIEDCLNGRRTVWDDPFKPGRNGLQGLAQRIEAQSPLALVVLMLGTNDFQVMHANNTWGSAQGTAALIHAIRTAPIEPSMPVPPILVVAPPPAQVARGPIAPKFEGAEARCAGLADALRALCEAEGCAFFDAGSVTPTSAVDGVHLDAPQHAVLGRAMATAAIPLLALSS